MTEIGLLIFTGLMCFACGTFVGSLIEHWLFNMSREDKDDG
jgi:hypothetical protein